MKHVTYLLVVFLMLATVVSIGAPEQSAEASASAQTGVGRVRFVNATPSGNPVDVFLDDRLVVNKVYFDFEYSFFNAGDHTVIFKDVSGNELNRATFTLEIGQWVTATLLGDSLQNYQVMITVDDGTPPPRNNARVQVVNAVIGSGPLAAGLNGTTFADAVEFGMASAPTEIIGGSYTVSLGDKSADIVFSPARFYQVFFAASDPSAEPRIVNVVGQPARVSGTNQFRFLNVVQGEDGSLASYDVYVNQEDIPTYTDVAYEETTNEYVVGPGTYTFDVYELGTNPNDAAPVATLETTIAENQSLFIIATGTPDEVVLKTFADDLKPLPVNTGRLQVINLTQLLPDFGLVSQNNSLRYFDLVPFDGVVSTNVPGGAYVFNLVDVNNPDRVLLTADANVPSGRVATLVVHGNLEPNSTWFGQRVSQFAMARFVHASPAAGSVDFYLGGELILSGMNFRDATEYQMVNGGSGLELAVYPTGVAPGGEEDPLFFDSSISILPDSLPFTFVLIGTENFRVTSYPDNFEVVPDGKARVTFVHAVINVPSLSVINSADQAVLAGGLAFGQSSELLTLNANTRTFNFLNVGVGVIYRVDAFPLQPAGNYLFILVGDAFDEDTIDVLTLSTLP